jgi:transcriptional regulator with XRE-family HTH domain
VPFAEIPHFEAFPKLLDFIANRDIMIAICNKPMKLGEKMRYLREVEGNLRGMNRAMTQQELIRAIRSETDSAFSQSYLSQIESGARAHLTNTTRQVLAKFFKVHPGYLVDDPEGYHAELQSDARTLDDKLDLWLVSGAERFRRDPELRHALLALARHNASRRCLLLLHAVIDTPGLVDRLFDVLGAPVVSVDAPQSPTPRLTRPVQESTSKPRRRAKKRSREVAP